MSALSAPRTIAARRWQVVLAEALRPEFNVERYLPAPGDPVLGRSRCRVARCEGSAKTRGLCEGHRREWTAAGKPELDGFVTTAVPLTRQPRRPSGFDLFGLGETSRAEWCYVLQCRHDERAAPVTPRVVSELTELVRTCRARSLLDRSLADWLAELAARQLGGGSHERALLRYAYARLEDLAAAGDPDVVYGRDVWDARRLGIEPHRSPHRISFAAINSAWLRVGAKRWARFRLATGTRFSTVAGDVSALRAFSSFLATRAATPPASEAGIGRALIEEYLLHLAGSGRSAATRTGLLVGLKLFLDHGRRHGLLPRLPASAVIYREDLPRREPAVPRFIDETAMAQLESEAALAGLPDPSTRRLVVTLIETGLRLGDACLLDLDCVMVDSAGWPCLRYHNSKVITECLVPLSERAAATIAAQQDHVRSRFPAGAPLLFPRERANPDGTRPYVTTTLSKRLHDWCQAIGLRDQTGQLITVTAHRFRHTLGTRMINQGVPVHIVQHYLGHASPAMTNVYAHLHDQTMRTAFEDYCTKRVNIAGQALPYDADSPTTDAEWIKHNLARVADSLPNGYCGRPPQRDCPHPNACLTCPDFQTTPEFLPVHRAQAATNRTLIARAEADGRFRLVTNLRRVQDSLDAIIPALEDLQTDGDADAS
ncbi:MAG: tyrosine-type recombinase/integrase [Acidimicrobiales bacterium]